MNRVSNARYTGIYLFLLRRSGVFLARVLSLVGSACTSADIFLTAENQSAGVPADPTKPFSMRILHALQDRAEDGPALT